MAPTVPFAIRYVAPRPGEPAVPLGWSAPFDVDWRLVEVPNSPESSWPAYTSVGWHVVRNALTYCPAFLVKQSINFRGQPSPALVKAWEENTHDKLVVTDRRTGVAVELAASFSDTEAVISWFVRGHGHEDSILCHDRKERVWYVENMLEEYKVHLGEDGTEVSWEEASSFAYLLDRHPHAVMAYGE